MLSPEAAKTAAAALEKLRVATLQVEAAAASANGGVNGWWAGILDADSTAAALASDAHSWRSLYDTLAAKLPTLSSDEEAADFVATVNRNTDTGLSVSVAHQLTPGATVATVAGDTVKELGRTAATVGNGFLSVLKASPWLLAGVGLLILWSWGRRRA